MLVIMQNRQHFVALPRNYMENFGVADLKNDYTQTRVEKLGKTPQIVDVFCILCIVYLLVF